MAGLIVFLAADVLSVIGAAIFIRITVQTHGGRAAAKASAAIAASFAAYNLILFRMGLGWTGQLAAFVLSAAVAWLARAPVLAVSHYPDVVAQDGGTDG